MAALPPAPPSGTRGAGRRPGAPLPSPRPPPPALAASHSGSSPPAVPWPAPGPRRIAVEEQRVAAGDVQRPDHRRRPLPAPRELEERGGLLTGAPVERLDGLTVLAIRQHHPGVPRARGDALGAGQQGSDNGLVVHPAGHNTNPNPLVTGATIRLSGHHRRLRNGVAQPAP